MLTSDDIWAELRRRRIIASRIAEELGVAVSTVTRAINGAHRSPRVLARVAELLDVPVGDLAPGLYVSNATRKTAKRSMSGYRETPNGDRPAPAPSRSESAPESPLAASGGRR